MKSLPQDGKKLPNGQKNQQYINEISTQRGQKLPNG